MSLPEVPHWDEVETRQRMSMYNDRTRCIDRVIFPNQDTAIGYFILNPDRFPESVFKKPGITILGNKPYQLSVVVDEGLVDGHFTPEYGISVVRGVDQIAIGLETQYHNMNPDFWMKNVRLRRIGEVKFSQPVVVGDTMKVSSSNLSENGLIGDSEVIVDGATTTSIKGIEFEVEELKGDFLQSEQSEYIKPILIEAGAQTAVADFLFRRDSQSVEEQAKGDFLVYAGIRGPIEFYEGVLPGDVAEVHMVKDPENKQMANVAIWVAGRKVMEVFGNECSVGNRERTKLLIDKVVGRRRSRRSTPQASG